MAYSAVSYSSEYEYGYSNNAAIGGSSWGMSSSLFAVPTVEGVDVNGVFYRYTAIKQQDDPFVVSVQNEAADGNGYIFRSTDDWTRGSGGTIVKYVPVPYSPLGDWGTGSIEQVGIGQVEDPTVLYSFRYKEPEIDYLQYVPKPTEPELYDAMSDDAVLEATKATDRDLYDKEVVESEELEERLRIAKKASDEADDMGLGVSQDAMMYAMTAATNMTQYYVVQMTGGTYQESVTLVDTNLPDNKRALRNNMAQQKLHQDMVNSQY